MGLRDWFKRQPDLAVDFRQALFSAVATNDQRLIADLCQQHRDEIVRQFPTWCKVPQDIRSNPSALNNYTEGMIAVATEFEASGDPSLMRLLRGPDDDNPIVQWQHELARAQALIESGDIHEAVSALSHYSRNSTESRGQVRHGHRLTTGGKLGIAHFHLGDPDRAIAYTRQALVLCEQSGDSEGINAYRSNLEQIQQMSPKK